MRALIALATGALLLASCETAFVGRAPGGRYGMVSADGRPPPAVRNQGSHCPVALHGGSFDLDPVARRFTLSLFENGPCLRSAEIRDSGSYLRRGGTLILESESSPPRSWTAHESGDSIILEWHGHRLRFRRDPPPR